ncbi:MAG TPA: hypothetical protein VLX68_04810 [Chitinivibrionales bacterium]|nr:hypothetical protein [Chitinivibrionales bacterium]
MALIECPECKAQISDAVCHCPRCGFHVKKCCGHFHNNASTLPLVFLGLALLAIFFLIFAAGVNVNGNNGMISIQKGKKGIFPRIRLCGCGPR